MANAKTLAKQMANDAAIALAGSCSNVSISMQNYGVTQRQVRAVLSALQRDPRFRRVRPAGFLGYVEFDKRPSTAPPSGEPSSGTPSVEGRTRHPAQTADNVDGKTNAAPECP